MNEFIPLGKEPKSKFIPTIKENSISKPINNKELKKIESIKVEGEKKIILRKLL